MQRRASIRIARVGNESPAANAGLRPGDELLSINSRPIRDILEYRYLTADEHVTVAARRDGKSNTHVILKSPEEDLGLEFDEELFDGLHTCRNNCIFCFLDQMPKGLRQSLYLKDDDYRLSFAHGNYITMTNLRDEDMDRICSQRISPLYVSVHATEPGLRARMFNNENAGGIMEQLRTLAESRITIHAQIVLCPGVNDGRHLERSVMDLASLHPWVASIALVPVGLTKYRSGLAPLEPVGNELAKQVVDSCVRWQRDFKRRLGTRLVFASDEFYLLSGTNLPAYGDYETFPQLQDGIGLSRIFLAELRSASRSAKRLRQGRYVLVTGASAAPLVERLADALCRLEGVGARTCTVKNKFFGKTVTVAGLLVGRDIVSALSDVSEDEEVLVPDVALKDDRFLDDMTLSDIQSTVGVAVSAVAPSPRAVTAHLAL